VAGKLYDSPLLAPLNVFRKSLGNGGFLGFLAPDAARLFE